MKLPEHNDRPSPGVAMAVGVALGSGLGTTVGSVIGAVTGEMGIWIAMGPGIGAGLGVAVALILAPPRRQSGVCETCGYSTRGLRSAVCPECGEDLPVA